MSEVLRLENVCKSFGHRPVVKNVSFAVGEGEIFGFLGPNGAGKTTTIKMVLGLLAADSGTILVNGHDIENDFEAAMSGISGIVENPDMYGYLSGYDNLMIQARACGADGMVGGQVLDTVYDVRDAAGLTVLNRLKTGVMISAAAELGCIASEMPATMRAQALVYADAIGRGFQIRDDMLDVEGDQAVFGKPIGSDVQEGKVTFVDVIGMDACRQEVAACTETAKAAVAGWPDHGFLWELADRMVGRRK